MIELKKTIVDEDTPRQALMHVLDTIRDLAQPHFTNPLEIGCHEPDTGPGNYGYFYIAEIRKSRWLGIFPHKQYRNLFVIHPGFYGHEWLQKEVNCCVFDHSLLDIVSKEIQKYADAFQATAVNLTQDFAP